MLSGSFRRAALAVFCTALAVPATASADRHDMYAVGPVGPTHCSTYVDGTQNRNGNTWRIFLTTGTDCDRPMAEMRTSVSLFDPHGTFRGTLDEDGCSWPIPPDTRTCQHVNAAGDIYVDHIGGIWDQKATVDLTLWETPLDPWVLFPPANCLPSSGGLRLTCEFHRYLIL